MRPVLTLIMLVLTGIGLASCVSIPNEEDDGQMWSTSPRRGLHDPDAEDEKR